jgi:beta-glucuronidase
MKRQAACPVQFLCLAILLWSPALRGAAGDREAAAISAGWRFQLDIADIGEKDGWQREDFDRSRWGAIRVPMAWDLHETALWSFEGLGWYAVEIPGSLARPGKLQRLKFGRVNYHARVWLNGELLGENANGWMPFEFNIGGKLKPGQRNHLVLRVDNRPRPEWLPGATRIEWVQYGGILGPVELETSAPSYISDVKIVANSPEVECTVEVRSAAEKELTLRVAAGGASASAKVRAEPGRAAVVSVLLQLDGARQWSPESPQLYLLTAELLDQGAVVDRVQERFGIRKIEVSGRRILLNGKPLMLRGVNRYDEYAPYGPNPPRKLVVEDLKAMKRAGVNAVRVHYPQSPELISLYDEMGFLMIEELPINWWNLRPWGKDKPENDILKVALEGLERMIRRDKNHPSIVIWSMANESPTDTETGIRTMRALMQRTRELDPARLVTFVASESDLSRHKAFAEADLVATNLYAGTLGGKIARRLSEIEELVYAPSVKYLQRALEQYPDKPVVVTEFGTRGIRGVRGDAEYSEDFQAACMRATWRAIQAVEGISGGVLWCWADYYHRRDFIQYAPFGPYGVVTVDRKPKVSLTALEEMFKGR